MVAEPWPDAPALLRRMPHRNAGHVVTFQHLAYLRVTLFLAPLVVAAEPERTVNAHAEPVAESQELDNPGLLLLVRRYSRLALRRQFRLRRRSHFLKRKEWQNHIFVHQVLFGGIE